MCRLGIPLLCVLVGAAALTSSAAAAADAVSYDAPVDAPVIDHFRPPPAAWAAGNRGIDYDVEPGTSVRAAAAGEVVFAGPVAGSRHVVVLHSDGIRTSYSFLSDVAVRRGQTVNAGQAVGTAGPALHFGARAGDVYLDPALLLEGAPPRVHLVAEDPRPATEEAERRGLERLLRSLPNALGSVGAQAIDWARDGAAAGAVYGARLAWQGLVDDAEELARLAHDSGLVPAAASLRFAAALARWWATRDECTPGEVPAPRLAQRRLLVLVGGLNSATGHAAILDVDFAALGYARDDVMQFSYRGGRADENPYEPSDTHADIWESGRRLRDLLVELGREHPGVPIDVIAHSQGGLVTRAALAVGGPLPTLGGVVTLATPHNGAPLATLSDEIEDIPVLGEVVGGVAGYLGNLDPDATSIRQLSEESSFIEELNAQPLPPNVPVTSIAARGDLVVPASSAHLEGAVNVVVPVDGLVRDHDALPGSDAAEREMALALTGAPPTCESLVDALLDAGVSEGVRLLEDAVTP